MIVVSDASVLINVARIGELDLLRKLYGTITVPEAVWSEVVVNGAGQPGAEIVGSAAWIIACPIGARPGAVTTAGHSQPPPTELDHIGLR